MKEFLCLDVLSKKKKRLMSLVRQEKISSKISFNLENKQSNVLEINAYCTDVTCPPLTNHLID